MLCHVQKVDFSSTTVNTFWYQLQIADLLEIANNCHLGDHDVLVLVVNMLPLSLFFSLFCSFLVAAFSSWFVLAMVSLFQLSKKAKLSTLPTYFFNTHSFKSLYYFLYFLSILFLFFSHFLSIDQIFKHSFPTAIQSLNKPLVTCCNSNLSSSQNRSINIKNFQFNQTRTSKPRIQFSFYL